MRRMPFGKHRGTPLQELPEDYLHWLGSLEDLRDPLTRWIREELEARESDAFRPPPAPIAPEKFRAAVAAIISAGYRAESKRSHPDAGGTTAAMQELNAAMTWLRSITAA